MLEPFVPEVLHPPEGVLHVGAVNEKLQPMGKNLMMEKSVENHLV